MFSVQEPEDGSLEQRVYFNIDEPVDTIKLDSFSSKIGDNPASLRAEFYGCTYEGKEDFSYHHDIITIVIFGGISASVVRGVCVHVTFPMIISFFP